MLKTSYITIYPNKIYFTTKKWQFSVVFKTVGQNIGKRQCFLSLTLHNILIYFNLSKFSNILLLLACIWCFFDLRGVKFSYS